MLDRLEISLAARHDEYSDFDASTSLRYGLLYRPASWIMLRASYGEGYKVPRLSELYAPVVVRSNLIFQDTDPLRGETVVGGPLPTTFGGNPDLQPEQSLNRNVGVVIDVLPVEGLSLAVDYYDTDYVDRIGGVSVRDRILQFPDTLTRGPKLPGDPADWLGPVVAVDFRSVNVASNRIAGVDITAKFNRATTWGDLAATAMASKALRNEVRAVPNAPRDTFTTKDSIPLRIAGSLFLMRGGFEVGTVCTHRDQFRANTFAAFTPSVVKWDVQFGYEFAEQGGGFAMSQLVAGTRIAVTIHNVFDREPPIGPGGMPDVTVIDAQMRRYAVQLTKRF
jgi:outer membrane receptor protein involved in Fe transport